MSENTWSLKLGANLQPNGETTFKVWAPFHSTLELKIQGKGSFSLERDNWGYFAAVLGDVKAGDTYCYHFENGNERPDPVSRALPLGVQKVTEIVDTHFDWSDGDWRGLDFRELVIYELHVGTFTSQGTFESIIEKIPYLKYLGINCIEIMPVTECPGRWNWGYDGVSIYAPTLRYGGVNGLKKLVDACHKENIAVCLDVVYNHLGPEGNYTNEFGPYFSNAYKTPWGDTYNYDGAYSDHVREYVIQNALYWLSEYHMDVLRLDAIHGIFDFTARPMLLELREQTLALEKNLKRKIHVVAESDLNDVKVIHPEGWNYSGVWQDDFHHSVHVALTGESRGYYQDFTGLPDIAKALRSGFVYDGKYSAYRKRRHGNSSEGLPFEKFVICSQNHDQIGNRPFGERLSSLVGKKSLKLAALFCLMTPNTPLLFMGEEYGEKAPFQYFVDLGEELMRAIFEGRKEELGLEEIPYPGVEAFNNSRLTWNIDEEILTLYRSLISLRKEYLPKKGIDKRHIRVYYSLENEWIAWEYKTEKRGWIGVFCYLGKKGPLKLKMPFKKAGSRRILFATDEVNQLIRREMRVPSECGFIVH